MVRSNILSAFHKFCTLAAEGLGQNSRKKPNHTVANQWSEPLFVESTKALVFALWGSVQPENSKKLHIFNCSPACCGRSSFNIDPQHV